MNTCRVRFAPSPTGIMHIGNVRTALLNYLFALKNNGTFILRVEDTDQERNIDPQISIFNHLTWLGLHYQEGPGIGGQYGPYFQSQRNAIYQEHLEKLQAGNFVYRCFCTQEQLEAKRNRQIALKNPPRYDKTCLKLSAAEIQTKLEQNVPFFWRMKIDETKTMQFKDLGHGTLHFDLKNFSDFAISRTDGSFTFMFANCIDDITMQISHILRGEDHLTNTVGQLTIMQALGHTFPIFWHLPILCNTTGKKLSKRDQGFSLEDLKNEGFLPQAILNYLGIIGASFEKEILTLGFLIMAFSTGLITFINDKNLVLWAVILFVTRVGACAVEIMCDTYFFKKVDGRDTNLISFYRMSSPVAYITGPAIATLIISFHLVQLKYLFLILGILMISGLRFALRLKDTK